MQPESTPARQLFDGARWLTCLVARFHVGGRGYVSVTFSADADELGRPLASCEEPEFAARVEAGTARPAGAAGAGGPRAEPGAARDRQAARRTLSPAQRLAVQMEADGLSREERLALAARVVGRPVGSFTALSVAECAAVWRAHAWRAHAQPAGVA